MMILGIPGWIWLLLLVLLALLTWLWSRRNSGSGAGGPLPSPPPYPSVPGSTSVLAGTVTIPQGTWSGPDRQARRTSETYSFLRQDYNPAAPLDPLSPTAGKSFRIRLVHVPEEHAAITAVTNGRQVEGSPWWGAVTGPDGTLEVVVQVDGRELASSEESAMQIIAEELDARGQVVHGEIHVVTVVPSGQ